MNIIRKWQYNSYWNIGFCEQNPEELIQEKMLRPIKWLKHPYRDRWFADPYILRVTESEIVVFVEECPIENPKGIICELVIERNSFCLKERYELLELDTHLSYPAIIRHEDKIYVYPENGSSGKLNIYEYDEKSHRLLNPTCILNDAVADATILKFRDKYMIVATKYPDTQENAYMYESDSLFGPFKKVSDVSFQPSHSYARPGGNWIRVGNDIFRPAQDCSKHYGAALYIMKVDMTQTPPTEIVSSRIEPTSFRYSRGLHTINFHDNLCVIDGYGYLYQVAGRFLKVLQVLKNICEFVKK